ncbi:hypothetical protein C0J52_26748 [Blattella germanica]|nr:hypothetical protein C0J52_26748 [Blattella germanica]
MVFWMHKINILYVEKRGLLNIISAISFMTRLGQIRPDRINCKCLIIIIGKTMTQEFLMLQIS